MTTPSFSAERLQGYLRASAGRTRETSLLFPFALFLHRTDPFPAFSYAAPIDPQPTVKRRGALAAVRSAFLRQGRTPRFEYVEGFAPDLALALGAGGFALETRATLMVCSCRDAPPAELPSDLEIERLAPTSPTDIGRSFLETQRLGFDPEDRRLATDEEATTFLADLVHQAAFLARLNGVPVGAAMTTPCCEGLTELVGLATLPAFRRRGVGSALVSAAVSHASHAAEAVLLTVAHGETERLYARLGFRPAEIHLSFADSATA